jgi:sigma-B regulation protein RsbU (phosphoserine phosphatase)
LKKKSSENQKIEWFSTLNKGGLMLGIVDNFQYESGKIYLEKDDFIILYTDGITEAKNADDDELGEEKLKEILINNADASGTEIIDIILKEIDIFAGSNTQYDDETLIILKRIP